MFAPELTYLHRSLAQIQMKLPVIFVIDDDPQVLRAISRDLKREFRKHYKILSTDSTKEALEFLNDMANKGEEVALFISDQKMPEMLGVDFLNKTKQLYPEAKRVLLTAYSDMEAAIRAINEIQLDYYLLKPWDPPEEKLFPVLNGLLDDWQINYKPGFEGIKLMGHAFTPKAHRLKDFLAGNLVPYEWMDLDKSKEARELCERNEIKDYPAIFFEDGNILQNPEIREVANKIGLNTTPSSDSYDVAIIGAGPAGLAAAVYGGSEGLKTILIEKRAPGGQAGTSTRIENYLGFPNGLSGAELTKRAITQAIRFGTEFLSPQEVVEIKLKEPYKILILDDGKEINAKSVIITTGVDYKKLEAENLDDYTGAGVYYGAATTESNACKEKDVYIVGGGNSAGQAAMYLANYAGNVFLVIRGNNLKTSMSRYLIDQIESVSNIQVLDHTIVTKAMGNGRLEKLVLENTDTHEKVEKEADALLIFIGARPQTDWLKLDIFKDEKGYISTGRDLVLYENFKKTWKKNRDPYFLETCTPGIFAAGDVRSGAMSRVASAVGEGAMAIKFVHQYLAEM